MAARNDGGIYPKTGDPKTVYLKNVVNDPRIEVGDFTIYNDQHRDPRDFETNCMLYAPMGEERLIIGNFCSIASGTVFFYNRANHSLVPLTTYPFGNFKEGWDDALETNRSWDYKGDIRIGSDVWIGYECVILPGVTIGDGAIVAARSVVAGDVPPYTIVGGAAAKPIRRRFDEATIERLLAMRWWDWPYEQVLAALPHILAPDIDALWAYYERNIL